MDPAKNLLLQGRLQDLGQLWRGIPTYVHGFLALQKAKNPRKKLSLIYPYLCYVLIWLDTENSLKRLGELKQKPLKDLKNLTRPQRLGTKRIGMTRAEIKEFIEAVVSNEEETEVIIPDDLDGAFIGISAEDGDVRAIYSIEKSIKILSEEMSEEEATEFFWYNIAGAKGEGYPLFINTPNVDNSSWTISSPYLK